MAYDIRRGTHQVTSVWLSGFSRAACAAPDVAFLAISRPRPGDRARCSTIASGLGQRARSGCASICGDEPQAEASVLRLELGQERAKLDELYPSVPSLHFDVAILEQLPREQAVLLQVNLGWSDPGNLYSLKEALEESPGATVTRGNVVGVKNQDSFLYNLAGDRLVAAMGLEGVIVVDTPEVLLVVHKDSVRNLGELLVELGAQGHEKLL